MNPTDDMDRNEMMRGNTISWDDAVAALTNRPRTSRENSHGRADGQNTFPAPAWGHNPSMPSGQQDFSHQWAHPNQALNQAPNQRGSAQDWAQSWNQPSAVLNQHAPSTNWGPSGQATNNVHPAWFTSSPSINGLDWNFNPSHPSTGWDNALPSWQTAQQQKSNSSRGAPPAYNNATTQYGQGPAGPSSRRGLNQAPNRQLWNRNTVPDRNWQQTSAKGQPIVADMSGGDHPRKRTGDILQESRNQSSRLSQHGKTSDEFLAPTAASAAYWNTSDGGDWESLRGSDSASNYWPGKTQKRIIRKKPKQRSAGDLRVPSDSSAGSHQSIPHKRTRSGSLVEQNTGSENEKTPLNDEASEEPTHRTPRPNTTNNLEDQNPKGGSFDLETPRPLTRTGSADSIAHQALAKLEIATTPYKSIIAEKFANRYPFRQPLKYPYKEVCSMFFCWQEDLSTFTGMIEELRSVFYHQYGSAIVDLYPIQHTISHATVCEAINKFVKEHSHHETLIVVYYCGGATRTPDAGLAWFPLQHAEIPDRGSHQYPKVFWEAPQSLLESTESDVLILLDTCGRYGDPPTSRTAHAPDQGKTELLASFEFEEFELPSISTAFTASLIKELTLLYEDGKVFSAVELHRQLINTYNHGRHSRKESAVVPFFMRLNGASQDGSILLKPVVWPDHDDCGEGSSKQLI